MDYNIELINWTPEPGSTAVSYFNQRLTELDDQPDVTIISAKMIITKHATGIYSYLFSENIPMPGSIVNLYHCCLLECKIRGVLCKITHCAHTYWTEAIDTTINDALNRMAINPQR